jgi:membrane protease YdiL (CAAX protease family)
MATEPDNAYAASPSPDRRTLAGWHFPALFLAVLAGLVLMLVSQQMLPGAPCVAVLALGFFSIQIGPAVAAVLMMRSQVGAGERCAAVHLDQRPSGLGGSGLRVVFVVTPLVLAINVVMLFVLGLSGWEPTPNPMLEMFVAGGLGTVAMLIFGAVVIAPVCEELLFRAVLHGALSARLSWAPATVMTALIFATVHGIVENVPALFVLGLILQRQLRDSGSLWLPIMTHAVFNGVIVAILLLARCLGYGDELI